MGIFIWDDLFFKLMPVSTASKTKYFKKIKTLLDHSNKYSFPSSGQLLNFGNLVLDELMK